MPKTDLDVIADELESVNLKETKHEILNAIDIEHLNNLHIRFVHLCRILLHKTLTKGQHYEVVLQVPLVERTTYKKLAIIGVTSEWTLFDNRYQVRDPDKEFFSVDELRKFMPKFENHERISGIGEIANMYLEITQRHRKESTRFGPFCLFLFFHKN